MQPPAKDLYEILHESGGFDIGMGSFSFYNTFVE